MKKSVSLLIILISGLIPAILCQLFAEKPVSRKIHITNFRYGKDPSVIRCNRGDTLLLTFSSTDTGHSFFLEEFDTDVKVSPSASTVMVFRVSNPAQKPNPVKEVKIIASHKGISKYLFSRSNYRCHVWCGPLHAFEQGKLVILPNTFLVFCLGCVAGILILWARGLCLVVEPEGNDSKGHDLLLSFPILRKLVISRWPQILLTIFALLMIYIVILTSLLGTKVSGRNLGVLLMWAIWLFLLVAIMTPILGRFWCTICPLPFFGDWIQRRSYFNPLAGSTKGYNNKFSGLFLKWPAFPGKTFTKLFFFMVLATFSTTLVAVPAMSGLAVLTLILLPTLMAFIWELRAFCRYVCPVSVFAGPYSGMSLIELRSRSEEVCTRCKAKYCQKGNSEGWACPYGLNVGELKDYSECGLCFECLRSCRYRNVTIYSKPFATETGSSDYGKAWMSIAIFTLSIVYSFLYEGHWPAIREYVNILDKQNWDLFARYSVTVWLIALVIMPGILFLLSIIAAKLTQADYKPKIIFLKYAGALLPLGLMLWISFVIPMLFTNFSFILQSLSDPFGWGWDFFGTANTPWHQILPGYVPIMQGILIIAGLYLSLRNLQTSSDSITGTKKVARMAVPMGAFVSAVSVLMLYFFTN
ncbi:MAG TPA: 4Fe-4S binding protein [Bacteroidales bacterium]|nr:4Fe-4S binding protein [Bacteroidales bacterium]